MQTEDKPNRPALHETELLQASLVASSGGIYN